MPGPLRQAGVTEWDSSFMQELERLGGISKKSFGPTIECTLDWHMNPDADFLTTDLEALGQTLTDVLTAASYVPAQLAVPIRWSKMEEVMNPSDNQKIDLVAAKIDNALMSHDELVESKLMGSTTYKGFHGIGILIPTSGQGNPGGVDASTETWWRNVTGTYQADGSDIEAVFTGIWNDISKGSGSSLTPKALISGSDPHALYEGQLQPLVRFNDTKTGDSGFKVLAFKTARYSFSQYGGSNVYFWNPKSLRLVCSKDYFRDLDEQRPMANAAGFQRDIYSACQLVTNNKSRLGVAVTA